VKKIKKKDLNRLLKKNVTDANISNFVNFEDNVNLDSIKVNEVDKMAEIRTCNNNGTCGLTSYGSNIANAYDKLVSNPSYANRNSCKSYNLTGYSNNDDNIYGKI
jgi:hypothetical protein